MVVIIEFEENKKILQDRTLGHVYSSLIITLAAHVRQLLTIGSNIS